MLQWEDPFEVEVVFDSDWLIGSGESERANVDETYLRDHMGLPVLPATSVVGVLRSAITTLAAGLDRQTGTGVWGSWADLLLGGQPGRGTHQLRPPARSRILSEDLRLSPALRGRFVSGVGPIPDDRFRESLGVLRYSVAIDEDGVAADDLLRCEERAARGLRLQAEWSLRRHEEDADEVPWPAQLLILGAAPLMTHFGKHRRRGAGRARTRIGDPEALHELVSRARNDTPPSPQPPPRRTHSVIAGPPVSSSTDDGVHDTWVHVASLRVVLEAPVVTDGRALIPGRVLLPVLDRHVGGLSRLLRSETVIVTDATPLLEGARSHAWPRCWGKNAEETRTLLLPRTDFSKLQADLDAWVSGDTWSHVDTEQRLHAVLDANTGRTDSEAGGLFGTTALAPGQCFEGQVWATADEAGGLEASFAPLTTTKERLGRSRKDSYGAVSIVWSVPQAPSLTPQPPTAGESVVLVCGSDLLLRDETGRYVTTESAVVEAVQTILGVGVEAAITSAEPGVAPPSSLGIRHDRSWQASWGLPRPTFPVVTAGSYCVVRFSESPTTERWQRLLDGGLGERTGEGFGRIWAMDITSKPPSRQGTVDHQLERLRDDMPLSVDDLASWERVSRRAWLAHIEEVARSQADALVASAIFASAWGVDEQAHESAARARGATLTHAARHGFEAVGGRSVPLLTMDAADLARHLGTAVWPKTIDREVRAAVADVVSRAVAAAAAGTLERDDVGTVGPALAGTDRDVGERA